MSEEGIGGLIGLIYFCIFAIMCLWLVLPFAVFGIKPLLLKIHEELKKINER